MIILTLAVVSNQTVICFFIVPVIENLYSLSQVHCIIKSLLIYFNLLSFGRGMTSPPLQHNPSSFEKKILMQMKMR